MTTEHKTENPALGRGLKILLGVSLALNFAIVGFFAGAFLRHDGWTDGGKRPPSLSTFGAPYMIALPREDRRKVMRAVRDASQKEIPDRSARRALYSQVLDALRASPFDRATLERVAGQQAQTTVAVQKAVQMAWIDIVADMTDTDRLKYAKIVEEVLRRGLNKRK